MGELLRLKQIVEMNKEKSFVKRILNPELKLDNKDGTFSTHSMSWGEADGKFYVFPTVLTTKDNKLKRYRANDAWEHTQATGNFIEFDSAGEAAWFSKSYKKLWQK